MCILLQADGFQLVNRLRFSFALKSPGVSNLIATRHAVYFHHPSCYVNLRVPKMPSHARSFQDGKPNILAGIVPGGVAKIGSRGVRVPRNNLDFAQSFWQYRGHRRTFFNDSAHSSGHGCQERVRAVRLSFLTSQIHVLQLNPPQPKHFCYILFVLKGVLPSQKGASC